MNVFARKKTNVPKQSNIHVLSPISPLFHWLQSCFLVRKLEEKRERLSMCWTRLQSELTHGHPGAGDTSPILSHMLLELVISTKPPNDGGVRGRIFVIPTTVAGLEMYSIPNRK